MSKHRKAIYVLLSVVFLLTSMCSIYFADYYRADQRAKESTISTNDIFIEERKNCIVFSPTLPEIGFVFYPGAKVEFTAYAPLMHDLAENGILCVLVQMPGNLAILNMDAAKGIPEQFPEITDWYIGGHSLGGSMAASYTSKYPVDFDGLVLLAAYSTTDISKLDLKIISLYGTEDGVLNLEKYTKYRSNLPEATTEIIIEGGNHAFFGSYGSQDGDGAAKILPAEQTNMTVEALVHFFTA